MENHETLGVYWGLMRLREISRDSSRISETNGDSGDSGRLLGTLENLDTNKDLKRLTRLRETPGVS